MPSTRCTGSAGPIRAAVCAAVVAAAAGYGKWLDNTSPPDAGSSADRIER